MASFRAIIDELHQELSRQGHPDARPAHGFALQAIGPDGATVSELGRRLGVSKQAAAKTAAGLERLGYVARRPHPEDGRAQILVRTARATDFLARSAAIFERGRAELAGRLGPERLAALEDDLAVIAGGQPWLTDLPGWLS
jgi:DNA-binding MarR family transcriptional regulator